MTASRSARGRSRRWRAAAGVGVGWIAIEVLLGGLAAGWAQGGASLPPAVIEELEGQPPYRTYWAVLVGIDRYQQAGLPGLQYAAADARAVRDLLVNHYGFPADNVTLLVDEEATKASLLAALAELARKARVNPQDGVLFYFSGHGQTVSLAEGKMGFLIPYDARVQQVEIDDPAPYLLSCVPMSDLHRYATASPAKHFMMLIDACFSGLVLAGRRALRPETPKYLLKVAHQPVKLALTAGGEGEEAYERPEWGHGAFTKKLLDALQPVGGAVLADKSADGVVTSAELMGLLPDMVRQLTGGRQNPQQGREGEGEFLLIPMGVPLSGSTLAGAPARTERDEQGPQIRIITPAGAAPEARIDVQARSVRIDGLVSDRTGITEVQVNGRHVPLRAIPTEEARNFAVVSAQDRVARFEGEVVLEEGQDTTIEISARDAAGNRSLLRFQLRWAGLRPPREGEAGQVMVNPRDNAQMVWVPAGTFLMGSPEGEGNGNERPQHQVQLDGFWLYKHEVTVTQYRRFCQETGRKMPREPKWGWQENHPVVNIDWQDAVAYCAWAGVRLPTEAEWESAARASGPRAHGTGDGSLSLDLANFGNNIRQTTPVGRYPAHPFGAHDLSGNVAEWCADWYKSDYYGVCEVQGLVLNPEGPRKESPHPGLLLAPLPPELAARLGIQAGALVRAVADEGSAERAGLKPGDVILSVAGRPVQEQGQLIEMLHQFEAGTLIQVEVYRDGRLRNQRLRFRNLDARVLRGGSWQSPPDATRSAHRAWAYPNRSDETVGFRCVFRPR